jgi:hypothetical protein
MHLRTSLAAHMGVEGFTFGTQHTPQVVIPTSGTICTQFHSQNFLAL